MKLLFTTEEKIEKKRAALSERDMFELRTYAEEMMKVEPLSVTFHKSPAVSGNIHDYFSEGTYWWPDPKNPDGPFIRRDGEIYPGSFKHHLHDLEKMSDTVTVLAEAGTYLSERIYLERAAKLIRVWFTDEATMMNPHLEYAQAIRGICDGRGIGIIDTQRLVKVVHSANLLEYAGGFDETVEPLKEWFTKYTNWLATSENGIYERDYFNNHSNWYNTQIASFVAFTGGDPTPYFDRFMKVIITNQTGEDGSFTDELTRTKSYSYSSFNLIACAVLARLAEGYGVDLWGAVAENGRSIKKSVEFFKPYYQNPFLWKYPQIHVDSDTFCLNAAMVLAEEAYGDESIARINRQKKRVFIPMRNITHIGLIDFL